VITIDELVVADEPDTWAIAGFAVDDDGTVPIGTVRVRLAGRAGGRGVVSWAVHGATGTPEEIDGLVTTVAPGAPSNEPAAHANGSTAIDHVVVATPDWPRTIKALEGAGFELRRERDAGALRQGFFRAGEVIIEVVGSWEPAPDAGPATFFGLAITVDDLDATKRHLGDALSDPKPAVQEGRAIATLRHRDVGVSTAIAFMSR
jgi:hypothetical protein